MAQRANSRLRIERRKTRANIEHSNQHRRYQLRKKTELSRDSACGSSKFKYLNNVRQRRGEVWSTSTLFLNIEMGYGEREIGNLERRGRWPIQSKKHKEPQRATKRAIQPKGFKEEEGGGY